MNTFIFSHHVSKGCFWGNKKESKYKLSSRKWLMLLWQIDSVTVVNDAKQYMVTRQWSALKVCSMMITETNRSCFTHSWIARTQMCTHTHTHTRTHTHAFSTLYMLVYLRSTDNWSGCGAPLSNSLFLKRKHFSCLLWIYFLICRIISSVANHIIVLIYLNAAHLLATLDRVVSSQISHCWLPQVAF